MLNKFCLFLLFLALFGSSVSAQFVREYRVPSSSDINRVSLSFSTYKSQTQVKRSVGMDPLRIHGNLLQANILPDFQSSKTMNHLVASLVHTNVESDNLGKSITSKLFSTANDFDHTWDVGLTSDHAYDLEFNLGMGTADFDLAQLAVSRLKIKSASADVYIHSSGLTPNLMVMDTLLVLLNMGVVDLHQAQFTQAEKVILEVNYGKINLDFSGRPIQKSQVIAAVGGGTIFLKLPSAVHPIKITIKTTPLCRTAIPSYLKSIGNNIFVTKGYTATDPKLMEFFLDVGVGSVTIE